MDEAELCEDWPGRPAAVVFRVRDGRDEILAGCGDLEEPRGWASVSKMVVALAMGVEFDWGLHRPEEPMGPPGSTLANLLSHSSGLGLEAGDPVRAVGERRVYSNLGVDLAVSGVVGDQSAAEWLDARVFRPLGMGSTHLNGRPAAGVEGSTRDLMTLGVAWLRPDGISRRTRDRMITPYAPALSGVVPGFGRFEPCEWGMGPELAGDKAHWMGGWPPESFGHFGQSGSLLLLNAREGLGIAVTNTVPFGPWAVEHWPAWITRVRQWALSRD